MSEADTKKKEISLMLDEIRLSLRRVNALYSKFNKVLEQSLVFMDTFTKNSAKQLDYLDQTIKVNSQAEETMVNILLAIKQNEYLQATHGIDKKVVGAPDGKFTWHLNNKLK